MLLASFTPVIVSIGHARPLLTGEHAVRTGSSAPAGTTTQPSKDLSLYGALSGTFVSSEATANVPHGSASLPPRVSHRA